MDQKCAGNSEPRTGKFRGWVFTICNYTEQDIENVKKINCRAIVCGKEIAPTTGTPHLQGAIYFDSQRTMISIKKKLSPERAKLFVMKGKWSDQEYCRKDGDMIRDEGDVPEQGKRSDVLRLKEVIDEGGSILDCYEENFADTCRIERSLKSYQDLRRRNRYRTEMTEGVWYWGATGVGKSHKAFEGFKIESHYVWQADNGWWDGYEQQDTVIMNEFRGQIPYGTMLQLVDKWPFGVPRRGREPIQFISKKVIVTSSMHPRDVYAGVAEKDSIDQLLRRFKITELKKI